MTPSSIDPAIIRALSLDASTAKIFSHGGSGFASTFRVTASTSKSTSASTSNTHQQEPDTPTFFLKTSSSPGAATMFEGEHMSLNAINSSVPTLCPKSFAWGRLDNDPKTYFLATEFLDLHGGGRKSKTAKGDSSLSLAQKLAKLHTTPAPPVQDENSEIRQFGFPVMTCCGDTPQPNDYKPSWADFYAENRLMFILKRGESRNGSDPELRRLVERTVEEVVPRLLAPGHLGVRRSREGEEDDRGNGVVPVVVHGDLWAGNHGRGAFVGRQSSNQDEPQQNSSSLSSSAAAAEPVETVVEDVIFDPSSCYAHSEYELGLMRMFGGFSAGMMRDYHKLVPKTEPVEEYEERVTLYELYHHLNHWAIFGGGYRGGAVGIMRRLLR